MTSTDEDIILNMMFALNQGNYLSKYDYMGEAEWKAMYNQLLSSPTGKTWDDKWIGFNCEDIFNMELEELGELFKSGSGINPTISRPYGKLMNIYTDDISVLPQYNEMNFGIDITAPKDSEVLSVADGEIISVGTKFNPTSRYGRYVIIKYNNNTRMTLANFDTIDKKIKKGAKVKKGQVLGTTGGKCKSYKEGDLHLEILYKDNYINPEWIITRAMKGFEDPIESNVGNGVVCNSNAVGGGVGEGVGPDYVETAKNQVGKPYVWGAIGPNSFDCSGLVYWSMAQHGITISRTSREQRRDSERITVDQLQPGDLIFRHGQYGSPKDTNVYSNVTHVMIYIGNNQYVHAPKPGKNVEIKNFKEEPGFSYGRYLGANGSNNSTSSSSRIKNNSRAKEESTPSTSIDNNTISYSTNSTSTGCVSPGEMIGNSTVLPGGMPVPLMTQYDSAWGDYPYGTGNSRGNTITMNGCAPTVLSMVVSYLNKTTVTPLDVVKWAGLKYYVSGAGTNPTMLTEGAREKWGVKIDSISLNANTILNELNAGRPVIANVKEGDFTKGGHYILLRGIDSNGKIYVNDPASEERSKKTWDISRIVGQTKRVWTCYK